MVKRNCSSLLERSIAVTGKGVMDTSIAEGLLEELVSTAIGLSASDIHFDPQGDAISLSYRIHGKLLAVDAVSELPREASKAIVARLKVLARMAMGDQRKAQDGHLRVETAHGTCDLRVATVPTIAGERAVVRLFPVGVAVRKLHELGMPPVLLQSLQRVLQQGSGGIVLVAGKIGVGKSTTLHALLSEHAAQGASVITIEDPVERRVGAYHQMAVDERQGWTFSECLRAALRQDPDWIMIGEIRDQETAQIAIRAGMTGQMIAATVHADDPQQALLRFVELGVDPGLLVQAVRMVIWQRLTKVKCDACEGKGCERCAGVGLVGRRADFVSMDRAQVERFLLPSGEVSRLAGAWEDFHLPGAGKRLRQAGGARRSMKAKRGATDEGTVVAESAGSFADYRGTAGRSQ